MKKTGKIEGTVADPTLPKTPIEIGGKTYNLCFTFGALARAEAAINAELARTGSPERVYLLLALPGLTFESIAVLFAAGLWTFHPEVGFEAARKMVTLDKVFEISRAIQAAYVAAMPEKANDHPPAAQASE